MNHYLPRYYYDERPNGDVFVSVYGNGWQRAYVITKAESDFWKEFNNE